MSRPQIAVVGSVDETRQFDPPVTDPAAARLACEEIGQGLAQAGWDLIVYSGKPAFVEADVVRGYLRADKTLPGSIHVRAPLGKGGFGEFSAHGKAFDIQPDPSGDWEVSFYRSLPSADGVLLVGGGRSTLVTGLIALTMRIPIIAAATFGGNAQKVWERLWNENNDATADDVAAMAAPWQEGAAAVLVHSVVAQRDAREHRARDEERRARWESRRTRIGLAVVVALLLLAVAGLAVVVGIAAGHRSGHRAAGPAAHVDRRGRGADQNRAGCELGLDTGSGPRRRRRVDHRPAVRRITTHRRPRRAGGLRRRRGAAVVVLRPAHRFRRRPDLRRHLHQTPRNRRQPDPDAGRDDHGPRPRRGAEVMDGHHFVSYTRIDTDDFSVTLAGQLRAVDTFYKLRVDERELQPGQA